MTNGKLDYGVGVVGLAIAFFFQHLPEATALLALVLIVIRIAIGLQEYRINQRKLKK